MTEENTQEWYPTEEQIEYLANCCHEINRKYCLAMGDDQQSSWEDAPEWQKDQVRNGVRFIVENPDADLSASHDNWLKQKVAEGWVYGEVKDPEAKTHPCCVPYEELPESQKFKDLLFRLALTTASVQLM